MLNPVAKKIIILVPVVIAFSGISSANISSTTANQNFTAIESNSSKPDSAINQLMEISSKWSKPVEDFQPVLFNDEKNQEGLQSGSVNSHSAAAGFGANGAIGSLRYLSSPPPVPFMEDSTISGEPDNLTNTDSFGNFGTKESFWDKIKRFSGYVVIAYYSALAHIKDTLFNPLPSLNAISEKVISIIKGSGNNSQSDYNGSNVGQESFMSEFENLTSSRFTDNNYVRFLAGGEESFAMKDKLMKRARKSIYVTSYCFHDDITGHETANILIEKKKQGLDVKVIVDYKISYSYGHKVLPIMSAAGVEILYYRELGRPGDIWHAKMIIVDDKYAIVGGMNFGDPYSHKDPNGEKWRDFDVLYSGPAVIETKKIFANAWNSKIKEELLNLNPMFLNENENTDFEPGNAKIAVVFQDPPDNSYVLTSILKGIYGARSKVNIANSYFIAIPAVKQAVIDARKRGVEVNILTNSSKSIDKEAQNTVIPIIRSLAQIYDSGINIYFSQDVNMHGKFITVDGIYANIGSYNLHPRGERYDTELNISIIDGDSVRQLDSAFESDINRAKKVESPEELTVKTSFRSIISSIIERFFFTML